jgi:hypothetical protein
MRYLFGFLCVCALGMMPLVGCSETTGDGGNGGTAGDGGSGGLGGSGGTALLVVFPLDVDEQDNQTPLPGVNVCQTETANCDLSDFTGRAELQLPIDQEIGYTLEKQGYGSQLRADVLSAAEESLSPWMRVDALLEAQYGRVMSPYPPEAGTGTVLVAVRAQGAGLEGATIELIGATGKAFYRDENGHWSLDLTATTSFGQGGFVEVSAGEVEVEIGGTASNCVVLSGWPSDSANTVRLPVLVGFMTVAVVRCD